MEELSENIAELITASFMLILPHLDATGVPVGADDDVWDVFHAINNITPIPGLIEKLREEGLHEAL